MAGPVLAWGTPDPITAGWNGIDGINIIRTAGQLDPFGNFEAIKLDEQGALSYNVPSDPFSLLSADGRAYAGVAAKQDTAAKWHLGLYDNTAGIYRGEGLCTWNGGNVPTWVQANGHGVTLTPFPLGNGWWWFSLYGVLIDPTHQFRIYLRPSGLVDPDVGATIFYLRKMVFPGDAASVFLSDSILRGGYGVARAPGKALTVYRPRRDYSMAFQFDRTPTRTTDSPWATGWDGAAPHITTEVGVEAFLKAARNKEALTWALSTNDCTKNQNTAWLDEPMRGNINVMEDGTRAFAAHLLSTRPFEGV